MATILDLTSVYAKIVRAEEHFKSVDDEIQAWIQSCSHTFATEVNKNHTRHAVVAVQHGPDPNYLRWTIIVGDLINNLRTALDHLIYSVAKYQTVNIPTANVDSLAFVIADTDTDFRDWSKNRLKNLSSAVVAVVESVQPYKRIHPVIPPLLRILREFSNADKHRLLRLASGGTVAADLRLHTKSSVKPTSYWNPDPIEDNAIICMVESVDPDPDFQFDPSSRFGMEVCLWHGLKNRESSAMYQRTGYSVLLPWLIAEVKFVVEQVKGATV